MKANTRRGMKLAFDQVADVYDEARPAIPQSVVTHIARTTALKPGDRVLDVGAGSGQLTLPLRTCGMAVTALEPGERLRMLLATHTAGDPGVTVCGGLFEDYTAPDLFAAVASANAWQWIDPAVSYTKAADLLHPEGHLILVWNFPIVADAALQRALNTALEVDYPDAVRDPDTHLAGIKARATEGRAELAAAGRFDRPSWQITTDTFTLTPHAYHALLLSYANAAVLDTTARTRQSHQVQQVLADHGVDVIRMDNIVYTCTAQKQAER